MYKVKSFSESYSHSLDEEINIYLENLDTDYQYVDLKYSNMAGSSGYTAKFSALLIMRYIPKRKILLEKLKV